jgi:uncharacterized caspase-like protein
MYRLTSFLLFIVLVQGCTVSPTSQEQLFGKDRRVALVIGNADYQEPEGYSTETHLLFGAIPSVKNDVERMTEELLDLNFSVISIKNANKQKMGDALAQFKNELIKKSPEKTVGLFYFSGHGLGDKENKETYLIPTDHEPLLKEELNEGILRDRFITQTDVYTEIKKADNKLNFVILDNCRDMGQTADNAKGIVATLKGPDGKIDLTSGANPVNESRPPRTILAYAAETNKPSLGMKDSKATSVYTKQLLKYISIASLSLSELFKRVSEAVVDETNEEQRPYFDLGEVSGKELDFVFKKEQVKIISAPP